MRVASTYGSFATALNDGVDVGHHLAAPVLRDLVDELLAEAGRAARVRRGDDPALRRPQRRIPSGRPRVLPRALRPAVDQEDHRVLLRGIEVRRLDQPGTASVAPAPPVTVRLSGAGTRRPSARLVLVRQRLARRCRRARCGRAPAARVIDVFENTTKSRPGLQRGDRAALGHELRRAAGAAGTAIQVLAPRCCAAVNADRAAVRREREVARPTDRASRTSVRFAPLARS